MCEPIIFIAHQKIKRLSADWRPFLEKLGINWQKYWDEFQADLLDAIRAGTKSGITWQDADKPVLNA